MTVYLCIKDCSRCVTCTLIGIIGKFSKETSRAILRDLEMCGIVILTNKPRDSPCVEIRWGNLSSLVDGERDEPPLAYPICGERTS